MLRRTTTEQGEIQGVIGNDPRITVYKGVPYAAPPVGDLRWRAPQPPRRWEGIYEASEYAPMAVQGRQGVNFEDFYTHEVNPASADFALDEDCLYLNVWTPAKTAGDRLPVYVWIHGGGYRGGFSYEMLIDGERMARRGIVFVSVAYRLNVFGFFSHPDMTEENRGEPHSNYGLLDQLAALEWVKRNAAAFGGDPDRITVGGQSAGAGSVLAHITSPLAKGLFAGAIMQSGGGLRSIGYQQRWRTAEEAAASGKAFLDSLGASSLEEARAIPACKLWEAYEKYGPGLVCAPVIDGTYLTKDPSEAIISGRHADVPYLIGYNRAEGQGTPAAPPAPDGVDMFREQIRTRYGEDAEAFLKMAGVTTMEDVDRVLKTPSFNGRAVATRLFCDVQAAQGGKSYAYYFDHDMPGDGMGPYHGAELWFVFESLAKCWRPFQGRHYDLARQACNYWVNFIKEGDPNGVDAGGCDMPRWEPYTAQDPFLMEFSQIPGRGEGRGDEMMEFTIAHDWKEVQRLL